MAFYYEAGKAVSKCTLDNRSPFWLKQGDVMPNRSNRTGCERSFLLNGSQKRWHFLMEAISSLCIFSREVSQPAVGLVDVLYFDIQLFLGILCFPLGRLDSFS
jgi:hypothetical protein